MQLRETRERQVRQFCAKHNVDPKISKLWIELVKLDAQARRPMRYGEHWDAVQQAKGIDQSIAAIYIKSRLRAFQDNVDKTVDIRAATAVNLLFNPGMVPMYYSVILKCSNTESIGRFLSTFFQKQDECESVCRGHCTKDFQHFKKYFCL